MKTAAAQAAAMIRKHLGWLVVWGCAFGGLIGLCVTIIGNL